MLSVLALMALHLAPVSPPAPNRQPQLAVGNGIVALVFGSGDSIWFSKSTDNGATFTPPAKIADLPEMLLGRHRGPRVAMAGNAIVVSAIAKESDLFYWRSTDGGRTWTKGGAINDRSKSAREGLHAMAGDTDGHMAAVWLDDRLVPGKRLWGAFSGDAGATWSKNVMLYESPSGTICECCHPSLAPLGHGEFAVMWRNALDGSRDFYTMRISAGKAVDAPVKQGQGTWKLNACPMDGGGVAVLHGSLISAWRREQDIYLAEPGKPELKLGPGKDVALAVGAKGAYAVWTTDQGIAARLPNSTAPVAILGSGAFPALTALPDGKVLAVWEDNGSIASRVLE